MTAVASATASECEELAEHLLLSATSLFERLEHERVAGVEVVEQHPRARGDSGRHFGQRQSRQAVAQQLVGARQQSGSSFGLRVSSHRETVFTQLRYR